MTLIEPRAPERQRTPTVAVSSTWMLRSKRRDVGLNAFDRTDEPVNEVDVVTGLIHQRPAIKLPGSPPLGAVVIGLRPRPEDVDRNHEDPPEASLLYGPPQKLQCAVATILLDNEQAHAGFVTFADHAKAIHPARCHWLFGNDMAAGPCSRNSLCRVQAAGRTQCDDVDIALGQQLVQRGESADPAGLGSCLQPSLVGVADRDQLQILAVISNRRQMIAGNAPAADDGDPDSTIGDRRFA